MTKTEKIKSLKFGLEQLESFERLEILEKLQKYKFIPCHEA